MTYTKSTGSCVKDIFTFAFSLSLLQKKGWRLLTNGMKLGITGQPTCAYRWDCPWQSIPVFIGSAKKYTRD